MDKEKLLMLQSKLQYIFNNISLLKLALTHKSYAYENGETENTKYNERIEFLGDAILEHIISDFLYTNVHNFSEGEMTKKRAAIVCESSLSDALKRIDGHKYIYLGKCEMATNGRLKDAIIADAFEAILGAIYLDGGYDIAKETALRLLDKEINDVLSGREINVDYKTKLQEILQKHGNVKIEYILIDSKGPDH